MTCPKVVTRVIIRVLQSTSHALTVKQGYYTLPSYTKSRPRDLTESSMMYDEQYSLELEGTVSRWTGQLTCIHVHVFLNLEQSA